MSWLDVVAKHARLSSRCVCEGCCIGGISGAAPQQHTWCLTGSLPGLGAPAGVRLACCCTNCARPSADAPLHRCAASAAACVLTATSVLERCAAAGLLCADVSGLLALASV